MTSRPWFAACLLLHSALAAQNLPFGPHTTVIETTSGMDLFSTSIFKQLLEPPFVTQVVELKTDGGAFTISFRRDGNKTMTHIQEQKVETAQSRFVSKFKEGGSYRVPHCVLDFLGVENTVLIVRQLPGSKLADLNSQKPFRAVVLDQGISEKAYSIVLQDAGGRVHHLTGRFDEHKDARAIAMFLARGRSVEFPAVLEDALLTKEQRAKRAEPKNTAVAVLNRYLGEWRGGIDGNPMAVVTMACHARPDGSGIWREITFSDGSEEVPPLPDIHVVEYDRSEQAYLSGSLAEGSPPPLRSTWNESSRTFTTVLPAEENSVKRVNTATFTRDNRIDWKTTTIDQQNQILATTTGHYGRVRLPELTEKPAAEPSPISDLQGISWHPMSGPALPTPLSDVLKRPPFFATVSTLSNAPDKVTLTLSWAFGTEESVVGKPAEFGDALSSLKQGETYEFPFCLQHPGKAPATTPATPEMKALEPFIGSWKSFAKQPDGSLKDVEIITRFFWSADGRAMWRKDTPQHKDTSSKEPPLLSFTRYKHIIYDEKARCYVELHQQRDFLVVKAVSATWDPTKKSFSWQSEVSAPFSVKARGVRRFVSEDRFDYEGSLTPTDGSAATQNSGYYERIKD